MISKPTIGLMQAARNPYTGCLCLLCVKIQIPKTKFQTNLKLQLFNDPNVTEKDIVWTFEYWSLEFV